MGWISNSAQRCQTVSYSHHGAPQVWEIEGQLEMENVEKGWGQTRPGGGQIVRWRRRSFWQTRCLRRKYFHHADSFESAAVNAERSVREIWIQSWDIRRRGFYSICIGMQAYETSRDSRVTWILGVTQYHENLKYKNEVYIHSTLYDSCNYSLIYLAYVRIV